MKKLFIAVAIAGLFSGVANAGIYQQTVNLIAGTNTAVSPNSYAVVGISEIDISGVQPIAAGFTRTVTLIHGIITSTVATIKSATNSSRKGA